MSFKKWINNKILQSDKADIIIKLLDEKKVVRFGGIIGSSKFLIVNLILKIVKKPIIFICKDDDEAFNAYNDLITFGVENSFYFPSLNTTPYQNAVIDESINSTRLEVLKNIIKTDTFIITASLRAVLSSVIPKNEFMPFLINLKKDEKIEFDYLLKLLVQSGYSRVPMVSNAGEFSVRGDIIDIYYSIYKSPVRIEFFDNIIEIIKHFNPLTQESMDSIDYVDIPPHKEFLYSESNIIRAVQILKKINGVNEEKERILDKIKNFQSFDGEEYYNYLFYDKNSISNYFDKGIIIIDDIVKIKKIEKNIFDEYSENYNLISNKKMPLVNPENLLFKLDDIYKFNHSIIEFNPLKDSQKDFDLEFDYKDVPVYLGDITTFNSDLENYLNNKFKIILFANSEMQEKRLKGFFNNYKPFDDRFKFNKLGFSIFPLQLTNGFISDNEKILFLNDQDLFGKRKKIHKQFYSDRTKVIDSFIDLKPGDFIVHINHGIGKFLGIERVKSFDVEKDYISILYADDDKVFVPIEQLNFVQKYISGEFGNPKLDKIGAKGWSKTKQRVKESIEELARDLIKLYSFRLKEKGFKFLSDTEWQKEFEAKFPYEETRDQLITLEEVKNDMESIKPMDRLICGDVGFGKTEIALRAAFKAVMSGKQVIILVPTTILAEQHYETFVERLKDYPVSVDMLSRFRSDNEQKKILENLKTGNVDIIIGTHRLLSNDVVYKNPGLLIVDEEQRFGVKHKERLKQIKKTLDCLSLTATPIPRTLHMSLSKIRDISIINTPPLDRQSVETYVMGFNEEVFINAVKKELDRKGQVFFLHNRIKTIYTIKQYIKKIIPEARVVVAHGRMAEDQLEDVIHSFIHYEYDILLTTTIIESGIDMPRVNTIFINRANTFGLSQLYQLKGRVGRSDRKAYAYLFYDPDIALTEDAMKRLRVISEYTELGSGFKIAMKDLEIRGAGNLLGPEQHGDILAVGYQLYCKLLSEALRELSKDRSEKIVDDIDEVYLELQYNGYIPDSYIADQKQKMEFYKKIAAITFKEEIEEIKNIMVDRFGRIPVEVNNLFVIADIRIICKEYGIKEIIEKKDLVEIKINKLYDFNINKLMGIISENKGDIYISGKAPESIFIKLKDFECIKDKIDYIKNSILKIFN